MDDELRKDSELFILLAVNSQIRLKISVIPILLTFIYLVHCKFLSHKSYGKPVLQKVPFNMHVNLTGITGVLIYIAKIVGKYEIKFYMEKAWKY